MKIETKYHLYPAETNDGKDTLLCEGDKILAKFFDQSDVAQKVQDFLNQQHSMETHLAEHGGDLFKYMKENLMKGMKEGFQERWQDGMDKNTDIKAEAEE